MVRIVGILAGAVFVFVLVLAALAPREDVPVDPTEEFHAHAHAPEGGWSWDGPLGLGVFGGYDNQQLQRGFKVFREVCSACHSLRYVSFRNLEGIGFSEAEVKVIAEEWPLEVAATNPDTGEATTEPAIPADRFPLVYPNEIAARAANNNAAPPDLSLMAKARADGANYIYSLMSGYQPVPADFPEDRVQESLHYNPYFHSLWIAMPPQLSDGLVTYDDGTEATTEQMAADVAAFLHWTAEPKMVERKTAGIGVLIFLLLFTSLSYVAYKRVWADVKASKVGGPGTRGGRADKGIHADAPGEGDHEA
ncbi:cytochrome c1 [Pacificimonas flava]|uniref:Cytochrome c1 n=2 Tax=Pacificimonas TaxID=1960290 RepID=A0A219B3Y3_9SPHN|nr:MULTISPECIES: cytochrome c1 [Pacificimonas]MBZ6377223.1 cytochrome c1 [Pacificimonas aurantium]OWV33057.1 cytochrome c1 [Pacificimonas flava]